MHHNVGYIENGAFGNCTDMKALGLSPILRHIGEYAFYRCYEVQILVIPSTVTDIGRGAFGCMEKIKILALPSTSDFENIHDDTFDECYNLQLAKPHGIGMKQWLKQRYLNLPLHTVCYNINVTSQDIQRCIQQHPESPSQQDDAGMTALHIVSMLAMAGHSDVYSVFHALYNANPAALFLVDIYGSTPLDYLKEQEDMMTLIVDLMKDLCMNRKKNQLSGGLGKGNGGSDKGNGGSDKGSSWGKATSGWGKATSGWGKATSGWGKTASDWGRTG